MKILYQTADFVVCRKAPGELSEHAPDGTGLPDVLAAALGIPPGQVYVVHRLDRTTGGLMVFALHAKAAASLSAQIQNGQFRKVYLAAVQGQPEAEGTMVDQLYFDRGRNKSFVVNKKRPGAKEARLRYRVLKTIPSPWQEGGVISLCRVELETGRTHQIRVQFASRQHPLIGDGKYGSRIHTKSCSLWSAELSFFVRGEERKFTDIPEKFEF